MNPLATLRSALRPRVALNASNSTTSRILRTSWSTSRSYSTPPSDSSPSPPSSDSSPPTPEASSSTPAPTPAYKSSSLDAMQATLASIPRQDPKPAPTWRSSYTPRDTAYRIAGSTSSRSTEPVSNQQLWSTSTPMSTMPAHTTTSSRSFAVTNSDVGLAFRRLNRVLQENNIKKELRRQEYFESPSDKRVRLDSERHRKRFAVAVGRAVSLSRRIQGN